MTLPSSGSISLADIASEFNLSTPIHFPSDCYGLGGAPASGSLTIPSDFYGRSGFTLSRVPTGNILAVGINKGASCIVTSTISTTFTWTLTSGFATYTAVGTDSSTQASLNIHTPGSGSGSSSGSYRVTASNGNYLDITFSLIWGNQ